MTAWQAELDDPGHGPPAIPRVRALLEGGLRGRPTALLVLSALLFGLACLFAGEALDARMQWRTEQGLRQRQGEDLSALARQLAAIDLAAVARPDLLATPAGRAAARASLSRYRLLLAERRRALDAYVASVDRMVEAMDARDADAGAARLRRRAEALVHQQRRLDWRQATLADAVIALVDWHESAATPSAAGARHESADPAGELRVLMARLGAADADVQTVAVTFDGH